MNYRLQLESGPFLCRFIKISSYALKYMRDNMRVIIGVSRKKFGAVLAPWT